MEQVAERCGALAAAGPAEGADFTAGNLDAWEKAANQVLEFGKDIDRQLFLRLLPEDSPARQITALAEAAGAAIGRLRSGGLSAEEREAAEADLRRFGEALAALARHAREEKGRLNGAAAFLLYDTYGFPLDLTQLLARENGLTVDTEGFERRMEEQRRRARAAQKREVIEVAQIDEAPPTEFLGYDELSVQGRIEEVVRLKNRVAVILDRTACYAEMGGQVGDTGRLIVGDREWRIADTRKVGEAWLHFLDTPANAGNDDLPQPGTEARLEVDVPRREAIQRHHTVTHLLHWALHEVVGPEAVQKGSYVGPDKLTFDFSSAPLTPAQVADVERLVNERILGNAPVSWVEVKYDHIRHRPDIMQFFGEKYGEWVRVVQIGGRPQALDGYAMELCGGTHTRATGEIGLFRVLGESAIAAGIRRIEAVAGLQAWQTVREEAALIEKLAGRVNSPVAELEKKIANLLEHQKQLEKQLRAMQQQQAAMEARRLEGQAQTIGGVPAILARVDADGNTLQAIANELKGRFPGVVVLAGAAGGQVALVAAVGGELTRRFQAGRIIQQIAPLVEGRGGGRPEMARGGGKNPAGIEAALAKARELLG
ncbi:MAG: hypothetical protein D6766_04525 [Verrucomicrobia bacterium]|nr:MAG: hypothetical protein D6766_04525 [Verrucomicrobiota bacterium]